MLWSISVFSKFLFVQSIKQNESKHKFHSYLLETFKNYNPDLIIFGHTDNVNQEILSDFRSNNKNIILIHGGGQSGSGFITTADGRRGWLHDFLSHGYSVYVVDQPGRARSGYSNTLYGEYMDRETNIEDAERRFTAMAKKGNWPQAKLHSQWPGSGLRGDKIFEEYMASQVNTMSDRVYIEEMSKLALSELIDLVGETVVLGHSQGGPFCWLAADVRPDKVKACVAVEPNGPPFFNVSYGGIKHSHLNKQTFKKNGL